MVQYSPDLRTKQIFVKIAKTVIAFRPTSHKEHFVDMFLTETISSENVRMVRGSNPNQSKCLAILNSI